MAAPATTVTPAHPQALFLADLQAGAYASGVDRGWWRTCAIDWPYAVIELALPPHPRGEPWFALRFLLDGYPEAPSAQPWNTVASAPLAPGRWPGGGDRIVKALNPDWRQDALYIPMDRQALEGHPDWRTKYACDVWDPGKDITQYLRLVRSILYQGGYTGARAA